MAGKKGRSGRRKGSKSRVGCTRSVDWRAKDRAERADRKEAVLRKLAAIEARHGNRRGSKMAARLEYAGPRGLEALSEDIKRYTNRLCVAAALGVAFNNPLVARCKWYTLEIRTVPEILERWAERVARSLKRVAKCQQAFS